MSQHKYLASELYDAVVNLCWRWQEVDSPWFEWIRNQIKKKKKGRKEELFCSCHLFLKDLASKHAWPHHIRGKERVACHPLGWHHGLVKWSLLPHGVYSYLKGTKPSIITQTKCQLSWQHAKEMSCGWTHHHDAEDQERIVIFMSKWCWALVFLQLMTAMLSSGDSQATSIIRFMSVSNNLVQPFLHIRAV